MNCQEARKHWDLYYDSEGDAEVHFRVNEHLQRCPECSAWFDAQSRLETSLVEAIAGNGTNEDQRIDWQKVLDAAGVNAGQSRHRWRSNWAVLLVAAATLALALASLATYMSDSGGPSLTELSADLHRHIATGNLRPDFESDSDLAVERYLIGRVSFPVRCPPRENSGFMVQGAGLSEIDGQPVAYVLGAVEHDAVSIFVLPKGSLHRFPREHNRLEELRPQSGRVGGYRVVYSVIDRNLVLVVGSSSPEKLERVLNAYGTYPHAS